MTKKQIAALFIVTLSLSAMGSVVSALIPVDAARFGASSTLIGLLMSSTAGIAIGNMAAGWLSDRLQARKWVLITAGALEMVTLWLIGQATNMPELFVFLTVTGFLFGMQGMIASILIGLFAQANERVGAADMGDNSKYLPKSCIDVKT